MNIFDSDAYTTERAGQFAPTHRSNRQTSKLAYPLVLAVLLGAAEGHVAAQAEDAGTPPAPAPASEEGTGLIVLIVKAGGEEFSEQKRVGTPLGLSACIEGSIEVEISGLPGSPAFPYLEVWLGAGAGECNEGDRSTRVTSAQNCTKLTTDRDGQNIADAVTLNTKVQIAPVCDLNAEQTTGSKQGPQTLWFLLLREPGSAETASFYRAFTINIDTVAPEAPARVTAGSDQADLRVTWASVTSATRYWVIAEHTGDAVADEAHDAGAAAVGCTSRYLRAGERLDLDAAEAAGLMIRETSETEIAFDAVDFDGAQHVSVAVAAQDLAGNLSVLSDVRCVTVTEGDSEPPSEGNGSSGKTDLGCACSAPGVHASAASSAFAALPLGLLLVSAYARRRARRPGR